MFQETSFKFCVYFSVIFNSVWAMCRLKKLIVPSNRLVLNSIKKITVQENAFCGSNFGVFSPSCLRTGMLRASECTEDQNEPTPRAFQVFIDHISAQHWEDLCTQRRAG